MSNSTNPALALADRAYALFVSVTNHLQSPLLLIMRIFWGGQLIQAGWGKLTHIDRPIEYFTSLGIPFPVENAWLVAFTETFGGTFLVLGLLSRLTCIPLTINFIVAYLTTDTKSLQDILGFDTTAFTADTAYPYFATAVLVLAFGPGAYSVDYLIARARSLPWRSPGL